MAKKIIVDNRFFSIAQKHWGKRYEVLPSKTIKQLLEPVCAHPDMALVRVKDIWIAENSVYDYYAALLPDQMVLCGSTEVHRNYPLDIAYNVLISEQKAFANLTYIDPVIKAELQKENFELIHVNQGYAKCSAAVAKKCIITADSGISKAAASCGLSVLEISQGDVALEGFDYGFIGGATGFIDDKLFFFGDIRKHRDFHVIKAFLFQNDIEWEYIPDYPLTDVGTIIGI